MPRDFSFLYDGDGRLDDKHTNKHQEFFEGVLKCENGPFIPYSRNKLEFVEGARNNLEELAEYIIDVFANSPFLTVEKADFTIQLHIGLLFSRFAPGVTILNECLIPKGKLIEKILKARNSENAIFVFNPKTATITKKEKLTKLLQEKYNSIVYSLSQAPASEYVEDPITYLGNNEINLELSNFTIDLPADESVPEDAEEKAFIALFKYALDERLQNAQQKYKDAQQKYKDAQKEYSSTTKAHAGLGIFIFAMAAAAYKYKSIFTNPLFPIVGGLGCIVGGVIFLSSAVSNWNREPDATIQGEVEAAREQLNSRKTALTEFQQQQDQHIEIS